MASCLDLYLCVGKLGLRLEKLDVTKQKSSQRAGRVVFGPKRSRNTCPNVHGTKASQFGCPVHKLRATAQAHKVGNKVLVQASVSEVTEVTPPPPP